MPLKFIYCLGVSVSAVLFAEGASDLAGTWNAVSQLGLAVVLAVVSFFLLIWWVKKNIEKDQKQFDQTTGRVSELERYIQENLVGLIIKTNEIHLKSVESIERSTDQMAKMTMFMDTLNRSLEGRACLAIDRMTPEHRRQVYEWVDGDKGHA